MLCSRVLLRSFAGAPIVEHGIGQEACRILAVALP